MGNNWSINQLSWTRGDDWNNVHFRMGGLHSQYNYMGAVGDHIQDSESYQIWVDAGIFSEGEADEILHGRDYKAGAGVSPGHHQDLHTDFVTMENQPDSAPLLTRVNTGEFFMILEDFLDHMKQDKTFAFFWTYMKMQDRLSNKTLCLSKS